MAIFFHRVVHVGRRRGSRRAAHGDCMVKRSGKPGDLRSGGVARSGDRGATRARRGALFDRLTLAILIYDVPFSGLRSSSAPGKASSTRYRPATRICEGRTGGSGSCSGTASRPAPSGSRGGRGLPSLSRTSSASRWGSYARTNHIKALNCSQRTLRKNGSSCRVRRLG